MIIKLKCGKTIRLEPKIRSETQHKKEPLTLGDIMALMEHDGYRRVKGRIRQRNWAEY